MEIEERKLLERRGWKTPEKEFNLTKGYTPKEHRSVECVYCSRKYLTKAKVGCCSEDCKEKRKKQREREYNRRHRKLITNSVMKYAQRNKEKINAKAKANYHIKMPKEQPCQFINCLELAKDKHHEDYNEPLIVNFYCRRHHKLIHKLKKAGKDLI